METLSEASFDRNFEENAHKFIIYFLYDDEDQNVFVHEVKEIDFLKVIQHLNLGGSVFITHIEMSGKKKLESELQTVSATYRDPQPDNIDEAEDREASMRCYVDFDHRETNG